MIEWAIKIAATAPSGAHRQPWKFVAVSDPETKRQIRVAAEQEERESYEGRMPDEWLLARVLGRLASERPYILFPIGYPAADVRVPDVRRKPLQDMSVWDAVIPKTP